MSRRHEDFDEFCDPDNPKIISFDDIVAAAKRIKPFIEKTPCIAAHHQSEFAMKLYFKMEFMNITGSFKERGSLNAIELLPMDKKKIGVVVASIGNDGIGICHYGAKHNIPVVVVMPVTICLPKLDKCLGLGAKVILHGNNLMEAQKHARSIAREKGMTYINTRDHPHVLAGYGTVALEILEQIPFVEAVIVPVGTGGLVSSVATVIKKLKPHCLVYGVQPESMSPFFKSLEADTITSVPLQDTIADAVAVPAVGTNSFHSGKSLVDKMVLVKEEWIAKSILHLIELERFIVEGAGACALAPIIGSVVPELKLKTVVAILSGGNIDNTSLSRCLQYGLSAEGRMIKFRVGIRDRPVAYTQLMKLLSSGGFNVVDQFHDRLWVEDDEYRIEVSLICETKNMEHALELKRMVEKAYPFATVFETEPFNDKRTCPCYLRKKDCN